MNAPNYLINPIHEIVVVDRNTVNFISPTGRFSLTDETGLLVRLVQAASPLLQSDAFAVENGGDHAMASIQGTIAMLVEKGIFIAESAYDREDTALLYFDHIRGCSGGKKRATHARDWKIKFYGEGRLAEQARTTLAKIGFTVVPFEFGDAAEQANTMIVACADSEDFEAFRKVNRFAVAARMPAYYISIDRNLVRSGPMVIPKTTACIDCLYHRVASTRRFPAEFIARSDAKNVIVVPEPSELAIAHAVSTLARVAAYVCEASFDLHLSPMHEFDILKGSHRVSNLLRLPRCSVCGVTSDRPAAQVFSHAFVRSCT